MFICSIRFDGISSFVEPSTENLIVGYRRERDTSAAARPYSTVS